MGLIKKLNKWANAHTYLSLDLIRVLLGVVFFVKGIEFMSNHEEMERLAEPFQDIPGGMIFLHYLIPAHFVGGILITVGLLTRWAAIAQLPILFGAILTNFIGVMNTNYLMLAVIVLITSLFFIVYGSGKHSVDYYLKMQQ
ncbi:MAG TPA: DoxX family membrane protein [Muricauda sp.]|uniref:DoxX family protein n=1 Tax=Flagellimonas aurea TaxID=2915619 RepID=A0ABS3G3U0_9FLAO|nr:DoxX family protein [Allomuricauda aurea]MBO0354082.1 DoxX family protein [Allomuricauda aurea]UBZ14268.1 DoxX family protein [Allomuricauda aquimarina]HBU78315.1 DoxX family membrane protein [Allomuricauda sp.]|tara:strand:+ start:238 stop:660 length:423 start_codon:yes stop_codon:yes gene_type:complete